MIVFFKLFFLLIERDGGDPLKKQSMHGIYSLMQQSTPRKLNLSNCQEQFALG